MTKSHRSRTGRTRTLGLQAASSWEMRSERTPLNTESVRLERSSERPANDEDELQAGTDDQQLAQVREESRAGLVLGRVVQHVELVEQQDEQVGIRRQLASKDGGDEQQFRKAWGASACQLSGGDSCQLGYQLLGQLCQHVG